MDKFRLQLALSVAMQLVMPAQVNGQNITIIPRVDQSTSADLELSRMLDFEQGVSLNVRTDPKLVPSARVLEMVNSIDIRDDVGLAITRGYDIDVVHDLVVAWSGGTAEITRIQQTPQGLVVAGLFKDEQGRIATPPEGSLAAYTTGGQRLCFEQRTIEGVPDLLPMSFVLLVDRSGSMAEIMPEVREAAKEFVAALPDTAECSVSSFAGDWDFSHRGSEGALNCKPENFAFDNIQPGGTTNIYGPLRDAYGWLSEPKRTDHQKAVILLTDGRATDDAASESQTLAMKEDAYTFVYFMGDSDDRWLRSLADNYFSGGGRASAQLERYFHVVSDAYSAQTVLELHTCPEVETNVTR